MRARSRRHKEDLRHAKTELELKQSQLMGASEQLSLFHTAMQHKEATLAQLYDEQTRLRAEMEDMHARWGAEAAAHAAASPWRCCAA